MARHVDTGDRIEYLKKDERNNAQSLREGGETNEVIVKAASVI